MKKITRIMAGIMAGAVIPLTLAGCAAQDSSKETTTTVEETTSSVTEETTADVTVATVSSEDAIKAVFENFTKEGSDYSEYKETMKEMYPDVKFEEKLEDGKITVSTPGSNDGLLQAGSCEFVQDGDYITLKNPKDDLFGAGMLAYLIPAVGEAMKMDPFIYDSYISGSMILGENNEYVSVTDEADGSKTYKIYDVGSFDMKGLEDMHITEKIVEEYKPEELSEGVDAFIAIPMGRIRFVAHGNQDDMTIAVGEYEKLTDNAYKSIVNGVKTLQPKGYEKFLEAFTEDAFKEQKELTGEGYEVYYEIKDEDMESLGIEDEEENFNFVVVDFGE